MKRTLPKCVEFISQIKETCYEQILEIYNRKKNKKPKDRKLITFVSDGFENYKNAFNKLFYNVAKLTFGIPIKLQKHGVNHNNNHIERYNGKIKDRIKVMRGGFSSFEGAKTFLNMRRVVHNFVNPHQGLKEKTPAEVAEIKTELKKNKLLILIQSETLQPNG